MEVWVVTRYIQYNCENIQYREFIGVAATESAADQVIVDSKEEHKNDERSADYVEYNKELTLVQE